MKQEFYNLQIKTNGQKLYEFTNDTIQWISQNTFKNGILKYQKETKQFIKDMILELVPKKYKNSIQN